ncbi:MAG TPA: MotA/TolQ/ExbB proton channel family protein [Geopsychrobacteraceae bacterium]|nr:MotA/TolQ/ExbB proton channel family protein [Geopsychrobacteraceae bacterium]
MLEIFDKGGPLMYPILVCSMIAWTIFFERLWSYHQIKKHLRSLTLEVERLYCSNRVEEAIDLCQRTPMPLARLLIVALRQAGSSRNHIKTLVEEVSGREIAALERYLGLLGTIATITPLLGLLGTVLGMIRAFNMIATAGGGTPATLGGGISEALITTAAGLSVAVPVILLHKYLSSRVDRLTLDLEECSMQVVDLVGN